MKNKFLLACITLGLCLSYNLTSLTAQIGPAILDLESTQQGFLPPRLTTLQRNAITDPVDGLIIFNTTTGFLNYYDGVTTEWEELEPQPNTVTTTQTVTYGPSAFKASNSTDVALSGFGAGGITISSPPFARLNCPIILPVGTQITSVYFYYIDEDNNSEMRFALDYESTIIGSFNTEYEFNTGVTFTSPDIQTHFAIVDFTIETNRSYFIDVFSAGWNSSMKVKGVRLSYTLPSD